MVFFYSPKVNIIIECWVWYSAAIFAVALRLISQKILKGGSFFKRSSIDDYLMFFTVLPYTIGILGLYIYDGFVTDVDFDSLTPDQSTELGRKMGILNILAETAIQTTLWSVKASLLIVFRRFAFMPIHEKIMKGLAVYLVLTYTGVLITLYGGWCRPFSQYLVLVPEVEQCLTWHNYNILQMSFNLSSDTFISAVPIFIIAKTIRDRQKRILLCILFSMGIFVIISAILMKLAVFLDPIHPVWVPWSVREISTAMLVGNLVVCLPLFRKIASKVSWSPLRSTASTNAGNDSENTFVSSRSLSATDKVLPTSLV